MGGRVIYEQLKDGPDHFAFEARHIGRQSGEGELLDVEEELARLHIAVFRGHRKSLGRSADKVRG